jgi:hypothetical protein
MNLILFHSESTAPVRELVHVALRRIGRTVRASRRLTGELAVIALLATVAIAVKLAMIAVSNATVAQALANSLFLFF